jgi:2-polyprenyl-3-methyl-5-hydroxy-6-metoxy-1,4-benzoquinol methylase
MTTDTEWQAWGIRDPYFAVLTNPKYRTDALTPDAKLEFFASGKKTVNMVLGTCRAYFDANFAPQRVLDFGCGVGRLSIPFAAQAGEVVGMDVAESMLAEARLNCEAQDCHNVTLVLSDDTLSRATGQFDLVYSGIVLQHIEIARGRKLFAQLVGKVMPGGCGVIQVTFAWDKYAAEFGVVPDRPAVSPAPKGRNSQTKAFWRRAFERLGILRTAPVIEPLPKTACSDPEMQMNYYNLSQLMFILEQAGVKRVFSTFTNHSGALGVLMYFQKPPQVS